MVVHETDCSMIYISTKTILFRNNIANKNYVLGVHIADLISVHTLTAIPLSYYISVVRASSDLLQLLWKVFVQVLHTSTNEKAGTLIESLFLLDVRQDKAYNFFIAIPPLIIGSNLIG